MLISYEGSLSVNGKVTNYYERKIQQMQSIGAVKHIHIFFLDTLYQQLFSVEVIFHWGFYTPHDAPHDKSYDMSHEDLSPPSPPPQSEIHLFFNFFTASDQLWPSPWSISSKYLQIVINSRCKHKSLGGKYNWFFATPRQEAWVGIIISWNLVGSTPYLKSFTLS